MKTRCAWLLTALLSLSMSACRTSNSAAAAKDLVTSGPAVLANVGVYFPSSDPFEDEGPKAPVFPKLVRTGFDIYVLDTSKVKIVGPCAGKVSVTANGLVCMSRQFAKFKGTKVQLSADANSPVEGNPEFFQYLEWDETRATLGANADGGYDLNIAVQ